MDVSEELAERTPIHELTDRELLEEIAENMRVAANGLKTIQNLVQTQGIMGLLKGFNNGR